MNGLSRPTIWEPQYHLARAGRGAELPGCAFAAQRGAPGKGTELA